MKKLVYLNIALAAALCVPVAMTASNLVTYRLTHTFAGTSNKTVQAPAPASAEDLASFSPILEKGLFGAATRGALTPVVKSATKETVAGTPLTDLTLLGTARGSFRETFALIRKNSSQEERVFRLGDRVFDLGRLSAVQKETVTIQVNGQPAQLATPSAPASASPQPAAPTPGRLASQVSGSGYVIDQRALNAALDNVGQAMTDARMIPSMKDGKVEGFRVAEVKPAGIFGMVGLKNGDVLLRINDFPIDSPEKAIQSLASLKGQNRIKLDLIRDGQPSTFTYDIR
jgi:general secretion pathway protein C